MSKLLEKKCVPCREGTPPLTAEAVEHLRKEVPEWNVIENTEIQRTFPFENFAEGLSFVNQIGRLADEEDHHPTIELSYKKATVRLTTHAIDGLSENDFILAAKIDQI